MRSVTELSRDLDRIYEKRTTTNYVHPTAIVDDNVTLRNCHVGAFAVVGSSHGPLHLENATIRSHSIVEGASKIGPGLESGHHVLIRTGNTIGKNLRIGSYSSLEGGAKIGDYVRFGGRCEMTQGIVGDFVRLYVGSVITDNPLPPSIIREPATVNHGAVLCAGVTVRGGVTIGMGAYIGGGAFVSRDVPDAKFFERSGKCEKFVSELVWRCGTTENGDIRHPWTDHFRDDYPIESHGQIDELNQWIKAACKSPLIVCPSCGEEPSAHTDLEEGRVLVCPRGHRWGA